MIDAATVARRAKEVVDEGARLLDASPVANKNHPWRKNVRTSDLDQSNGFQCVLAHIFGDYWKGMEALGLMIEPWGNSPVRFVPDALRGSQYGFSLGTEPMTWDALNVAWIEKVRPLHREGRR